MKTTASSSDGSASAARGPSASVVAAGLVLALGVGMLVPKGWFVTNL
jgi:hypothetical protein